MSKNVTVSDVIAELKIKANSPKVVRDWKSMIPAGSRWFPGSKGNPSCNVCLGLGLVRMELENGPLPVGHKYFGKLIVCGCVQHVLKDIPVEKGG